MSISQIRVGDVVAFVVGGATFEESRDLQMLQQGNPAHRIFLGGSSVLNTSSFLDAVLAAQFASDSVARRALRCQLPAVLAVHKRPHKRRSKLQIVLRKYLHRFSEFSRDTPTSDG